MKRLEKIKEAWRVFRKDRPGWRFGNFHRRWHERSTNPFKMIARVGLGILLIIAGLGLGLVPGVPGVFLGIAGLALIVSQFHAPALWLDSAEMTVRSVLRKWRRRWANR